MSVTEQMVEIVSAPVGSMPPRVFRGVFNPGEVFTLGEAMYLFQDDGLRDKNGPNNVEQGHEQISMVHQQQAVANEKQLSWDDASRLRSDGATVMFRWLHTLLPAVAECCQVFADATGLEMFANGFWTPGGHQGFPFHADMDSVFSFQESGEKTWLFFEPRTTDPADTGNMGWIETEDGNQKSPQEKAYCVLTARPGDVIVSPRGWGHRALAKEGSDSIHVSFGVLHTEIAADMRAHQYPLKPRTA